LRFKAAPDAGKTIEVLRRGEEFSFGEWPGASDRRATVLDVLLRLGFQGRPIECDDNALDQVPVEAKLDKLVEVFLLTAGAGDGRRAGGCA
jgi:hypothetical protein